MNTPRGLKLLLMTAWGGVPLTLLANGLRLGSQDGFATARGDAFVATADNASAIYYNPAGITQLEGNQIRGGIYGIYLDPSYRPPSGAPNSGETYHIENSLAGVPQFFFTHTPESFPLSVGLGVYAPFGLGTTWPQDTGFRTVAIEGSLTYATINPVVAIEVAPGLSMGGGVTVSYGKLNLEQGLLQYESPFANFFSFTGDGWSVGYNLGLLWQPHEKVSFGAAFRSSASFTLDGQTEFEQQPIIPEAHLSAEADFKFPLSAVVGVSFRPTSKWNLEFDADYTDWSSFGTVTIRQASPPPFPMKQDIPVTLDWQPTWTYQFGVTRYLEHGWHVSGGYVFSENAVPDAYYTPIAADMNRHFFSVGTGFRGRRFDLDVAYQFGYGPTRTVTGSTPSSQPAQFAGQTADGQYDFSSHAVMLTVGVHF
jgi:long-chain fatty acid transport protein